MARRLNSMKRNLRMLIASGCLLLSLAVGAAETPRLDWRMPKGGSREGDVVTVSLEQKGTAMFTAPLDLSDWEGKVLKASIRVRGENVVPSAKRWLGFKFMLHYRDAMTGRDEYPGASAREGSWDWTVVEVSADLRGVRPEKGSLSLGLQDGAGTVSFDLSSLTFEEVKPLFSYDDGNEKCLYSPQLKNQPPLKGVMLPSGPCKEDDFRTLKSWGATLARYQMTRGWSKRNANQDVEEYLAWVDSKVDHLLRDVLPWAEKYGIRIVVDLHVAPGGRDASGDMNMFYDETFATAFLEAWKRIAGRCRGQKGIWGYDLINEPSQNRPAAPDCDYWTLQARAARLVREIDPVTPIIVESNGWDSPKQFVYMKPLDLKDVIYQAHMYDPGYYTHQGVHAPSADEWDRTPYPCPEKKLDKTYLRTSLKPVLDFQKRHDAVVYIGEFSAISWAEGADAYLRDCMAIFNEYGWHWTYHAFREWEGWSVEHESTGWRKFRPAAADTPRKRALQEGIGGSSVEDSVLAP